jgi:hypothetical protein
VPRPQTFRIRERVRFLAPTIVIDIIGSFRPSPGTPGGARPRGAARVSKNFETFCFSLGDAMTELEETHSQLLLLRGYACEAVCKGSDALFESVAGPLRPACAPLL